MKQRLMILGLSIALLFTACGPASTPGDAPEAAQPALDEGSDQPLKSSLNSSLGASGINRLDVVAAPPDEPPHPPPLPVLYTVTGTLVPRASAIHPNDGSFTSAGGNIHGELIGPLGSDFDLYLYKKVGKRSALVARSDSPSNAEVLDYLAAAGTYFFRVRSDRGAGEYTLNYYKTGL